MTDVKARPGQHWSKSTIKKIVSELKNIREGKGVITPGTVVDAARDPGNPLHEYFDWDDSSAAEKYRHGQARQMLGRVQVYVDHEGAEQPMRTYLNVVVEDVRQYVPVVEIAKDPVLTAQVIQSARMDLESWRRRYQIYSALLSANEKVKEAIVSLPGTEGAS